VFIWLVLLVIALLIVGLATGVIPSPLPPLALEPYTPWIILLLVILATKLLLEIIKPLFRATLSHRIPSDADIHALFQVFSYVVWVLALLFAFWFVLGGGSVFAGLTAGLVGGALIIVLQEPILNVVGWAILVTQQIYKLGDRIEINGVRGYVVAIHPMNTTLREFGGWMLGDTFTGRYVRVPNRQVLAGNVFNFTKDTPFIWDELVMNVTYESDLKAAERHILEAAEEVVGDLMRENRELVRERYEFRDLKSYMIEEPTLRWRAQESYVALMLQYFVPAFRRRYYRSEITKRVLEKFQTDPMVHIAYPHLQVVPSPYAALRLETKPAEDTSLP
jgi:small-conductance mechanosensitive channel